MEDGLFIKDKKGIYKDKKEWMGLWRRMGVVGNLRDAGVDGGTVDDGAEGLGGFRDSGINGSRIWEIGMVFINGRRIWEMGMVFINGSRIWEMEMFLLTVAELR